MKKILYMAVCLSALWISGCKKSVITQISNPATGGRIKFFHAAPGVPALNVLVDGVQINAAVNQSVTDNQVATSIVTGYPYSTGFPASNYAVIASGNHEIKIGTAIPVPALVSAQTVAPGTTISTITQAIADTSVYSVFTCGLPGSATTPLISLVIKDVFPAAVAGKAYVRLINLIPNGGAVDVTGTYTPVNGTSTTVTPVTNISYGKVSGFIAVDVNPISTTSYVFQANLAGTATKLGSTVTASLAPGRYYTLILKGLAADYPVPGTSIVLKATARPTAPATDPATKLPEIYFNAPGLVSYTNK